MSTSKRPVYVLIVACGVSLLLGYEIGVHRSSSGMETNASAPTGVRQSLARESSASPGDRPQPRSEPRGARQAVDPTAELAAQDPPSLPALETLEYALPAEAELQRRYGSLASIELVGAQKGLEYSLSADTRVLLEEYFKRGLYRTFPGAAGQPIDGSLRSESGSLQSTLQRFVPQEDGSLEAQVATVRYDDYPNLVAKSYELKWVAQLLADKYGIVPGRPRGNVAEPE